MANIQSTVGLTGLAAPKDDTETFATIDPIWGIDGLRSVATIAQRNNITTERRRFGMVAVIQGDGTMWQLKSLAMGGVNTNLADNANWLPFITSAAVVIPTATANIYVSALSGVAGDMTAGSIIKPFANLIDAYKKVKGLFPFTFGLSNVTINIIDGIFTIPETIIPNPAVPATIDIVNFFKPTVNYYLNSGVIIEYSGDNYLFNSPSVNQFNTTRVVGNNANIRIGFSSIGGIFNYTGSTSSNKNQLYLEGIVVSAIKPSSTTGVTVRNKPLIYVAGNQTAGFNLEVFNCTFSGWVDNTAFTKGFVLATDTGANVTIKNTYIAGVVESNSLTENRSCISIETTNGQVHVRVLFQNCIFAGTLGTSLIKINGEQQTLLFKDCVFQGNSGAKPGSAIWIVKPASIAAYTNFAIDGCVFSNEFMNYNIISTSSDVYSTPVPTITSDNVNIKLGFNKVSIPTYGVIVPFNNFVTPQAIVLSNLNPVTTFAEALAEINKLKNVLRDHGIIS